ncbi:hypothetical protein IWW36_001603 [Coemansia brasiliensis]|uniref:RING-type E3 ubiquitin transferase n=1 Tax=Coemansia brasiliensis TaxID=2650707 RepID=A0A9W8LYW7_9FUNG|nr:hypothetical protein IWW36_001603 [Coemansia brasiliensis]
MPNHIVENAFKHVSERFSDRARVGKKSKSLSTKKYYARIQQAIDNSLAETCLAFTLKPNNVRVPGVSSVNILKNRKYMVPLNDDGLPVDSMDDYEAADHPERRKWAESRGMAIPPSAVDEDDGKYIFKKSDYSTVYLPPMIELRETLYFSILIGVFSTMAFVALLCIWNIGYFILKWLHINNISVVVLLFTGYLTTLLGALFAVSVVKLWHGSSPMANVTVGGQVIKSTFNAVCKAASIAIVFGVFLPTLLGMVKEMYISVPYYHYYSSGYPQYSTETSLLQFAFRIWKCNVILAIAGSFSLFLATDNEWLDDVYEGIYRRDSLRQVWRLIKRRAIPAAVRLAVIYLLPIVLATVNMKLDNSLTSDAFRRLLLLKDVHVLAPLVRISMLSCTAVLFVTKVAMTYRNCVHMIRDKLYAVGQVLENVDGSSTPHFRPSEPTTPTTI